MSNYRFWKHIQYSVQSILKFSTVYGWKLWERNYNVLRIICSKYYNHFCLHVENRQFMNFWNTLTIMPSLSKTSIISGFSLMIAIDKADLPNGSTQLMSNNCVRCLNAQMVFATEAVSPRSTNRMNRFSSGVKTWSIFLALRSKEEHERWRFSRHGTLAGVTPFSGQSAEEGRGGGVVMAALGLAPATKWQPERVKH